MSGPSFPVSVAAYPVIQDNINFVYADDQNNPNSEISAIETMVGSLGLAQGYSTDLVDALVNCLKPTMKLVWNSTSTITVSAGRIACQKADGTQRVFRKNASTTDLTSANLDAGGPNFANSTGYWIFANADAVSTGATFKITTSSTTPSGITCLALVGGFATDSSGLIIEQSIWSIAPIQILSIQEKTYGDYATYTSQIPYDNSIPQNTEGTEIMTLTAQPKSASTKFLVLSLVFASLGANNRGVVQALFRDSVADALAFGPTGGGGAQYGFSWLIHNLTTPGTSPVIFKVRAGSPVSEQWYWNGDYIVPGRIGGGVGFSRLMVIAYE